MSVEGLNKIIEELEGGRGDFPAFGRRLREELSNVEVKDNPKVEEEDISEEELGKRLSNTGYDPSPEELLRRGAPPLREDGSTAGSTEIDGKPTPTDAQLRSNAEQDLPKGERTTERPLSQGSDPTRRDAGYHPIQ